MNSDISTNPALTDYSVPEVINDTIQQLRFIPNKNSNILAGVGWDCKLRLWNLQYNVNLNNNNAIAQIQTSLIFNLDFPEPLLSVCWQPDATNIFTGSTDGTISAVDLNSSKAITIGKHSSGVKDIAWIPNFNCLVSGGWDGNLCIWDTRSPQPAMMYNLQKKVFSMSLTFPLLVVAMEGRLISYFNLNKLSGGNFVPEACFESHLKFQTRVVTTFPEANGYAIGSIEGRVAIKFIDLNKQPAINEETKSMVTQDDFAFRCHRDGTNLNDVYAVNDIKFNPTYGTFATGGGDGSWMLWDKDARSRLKQGYHQNKAPITALDYSANGDLLAYASGYDWAKGIEYENSTQPKLTIHYLQDPEKKKKAKK